MCFSFLSHRDEKPWCILWCQQKKYHEHKAKELIDIWWWMLLLLPGLHSVAAQWTGVEKVIKVVFVVTTMDTFYVCAQEAFCPDNNSEKNNFLLFKQEQRCMWVKNDRLNINGNEFCILPVIVHKWFIISITLILLALLAESGAFSIQLKIT